MPNWCSTSYKLLGRAGDVEKAYKALHALEETKRSQDVEPWSFLKDSRWLGYVVQDVLGKSPDDVKCRGTFSNLSLTEHDGRPGIGLFTETAWGPCTDMWRLFANKFHLSLNYIADEPGCCLYEKESPDGVYPTSYVLDSDWEGREYFDTLEEFIKAYGEQLGIPQGSTSEQVEAIVDSRSDCSLHRYESDDDATRP